MSRRIQVSAAVIAVALASGTATASGETRTRLGILECTVEGGIGLIVGSNRKADCTFVHKDGAVEKYSGELSKFGLDIGVTDNAYLGWIVFTPAGSEYGAHSLAGRYVGISAAGALGIGLGVNALVGGSTKNIGLQPFSIEGKTGLNLAAGFASLTLEPHR
ncbi:MAG: DUF992 domain-containing protein [Alphaproteobacteria bacterium]|nr:DUF992 domain-containing protein [Alphaproteobacteria bacterium]